MIKKKSGRKSQRGQSLVEFSVSVAVLLVVLSGIVDIGRAFFTFVAIENAAGEGVLYASYHPTWITQTDAQDDGAEHPEFDNITYRAVHESPTGVVDWNLSSIRVEAPNVAVGEPITVTVSYSYTLLTPFLNLVTENGVLPLHASATQSILHTD